MEKALQRYGKFCNFMLKRLPICDDFYFIQKRAKKLAGVEGEQLIRSGYQNQLINSQ